MTQKYAFSPETLIKAYALGVFPMADDANSQDIHFYDPDFRGLIPLTLTGPEAFHVPRRLRKTVRQSKYRVTIDQAFSVVIAECAAPRPERSSTWINHDIKQLYIALHKIGFAHSIEVWDGDMLVGGLYGVALRAAFFGESMFSRVTDASKIALVHLVARLRAGGFHILDAQFHNDHLEQFGIIEVPREDFQNRLALALGKTSDLQLDSGSGIMVTELLQTLGSGPASS